VKRLTYDLAKNASKIIDIGTGPNGSDWWQFIKPDAELFGIDLYYVPRVANRKIFLMKMDALELAKVNSQPLDVIEIFNDTEVNKRFNIDHRFDLVMAEHVFEHVSDPERLIKGISLITEKNAYVHIAIPDPDNFTDKFYHLIHPDGGGHVSFIRKDELIILMKKYSFKFIESQIWPDDWMWLESSYNLKDRGIQFLKQEDLRYIADVFRKELTVEKGYYYGDELVFRKM
jgi:SAM-dependent methyltransferase